MQEQSLDKPRVLFINSPLTIGADTWVHLLLLRHLPQAEFELHAAGQPAPRPGEVAPAYAALTAIAGVHQRPTDFGPSLSGLSRPDKLRAALSLVPASASMLGLAAYIRQKRIQILHSTDRPRDAIACVALAALTGAKSVIHVHVKYDAGWMSKGVRWAFGRADRLVGVSKFVADSLIDGGYPRERVRGIVNSIDVPAWDPALDPAPGRASLGVSASAPLIVTIGRIYGSKGQQRLIRALPAVKSEFPDVRLAIVGSDYPEGSGATPELKKLARELGVFDNVVFAGQRKDVAGVLAACDVFALSSFEEPFGLVYTEAMAMKRPVVGVSNGGTLEVIEHGKSGLLGDTEDIDTLANNLRTLLRDPALRTRMGEYARKQVEQRFSAERLARDVGAMYVELLA